MCGEHSTVPTTYSAYEGSSPHVRGAHSPRNLPRTACGIIPACAGSTERHHKRWFAGRDHPRMCGEHSPSVSRCEESLGSSPHVRGAPDDGLLRHLHEGIIPACAGSTTCRNSRASADWDHPRMCGEHRIVVHGRAVRVGSSPHVRGAPGLGLDACPVVGIIPACAGSTCFRAGGYACRRDHPRMCGEHSMGSCSRRGCWGSSPHVRGAPALPSTSSMVIGIIPACAGSTLETIRYQHAMWDHPRMCGEHWFGDLLRAVWAGSSPHVRGAHPVFIGVVYEHGIIPACAGSTRVQPDTE